MPVIKSAIKKLRKDRKRELINDIFRRKLESAVQGAKKTHTHDALSEAVSLIDKAVKNHILHENKGNRLKSQLAKATIETVLKKSPTKTTSAKSSTKLSVKKSTLKKPIKKTA